MLTAQQCLYKLSTIVSLEKTICSLMEELISADTELKDTFSRVKNLEQAAIEVRVSEAGKNIPSSIGSTSVTTEDIILGKGSVENKTRKVKALERAQRLYKFYHPDHTPGREDLFHLLRTAAKSGHLEIVHLLALNAEQESAFSVEAIDGYLERRRHTVLSSHYGRAYMLYKTGNTTACKARIKQALISRFGVLAGVN
jgi:hypothetical protein